MADSVETYAGEWTPWWAGISPTAKKMLVLSGAVSAAEMQAAAGLTWTVSKQPAFVTGDHAGRIPGWNAVQRDTDGAIYGMVKNSYTLFQNTEGFENMEALMVAADGELKFASSGGLFGGALVWALAKVDKEIYVRGDGSPYADFILGMWGHDGRHAFMTCDTNVRVVCDNTASAAVAGATHKVSIRHTSNMGKRIEAARKALDLHLKYQGRLVATLTDLTYREMDSAAVARFAEALLPVSPDVKNPFKTTAERAKIVALFDDSPTLAGVPLTAYRAYQAVTEYLDHKDTRDTKTATGFDRRAIGIVEGTPYALKSTALALLAKA